MKKESNFEITNVDAYTIGNEIFITMQWDGDESGVDDLFVVLLNGEKEFLFDIIYPEKKVTFRLNYQEFEYCWEKDQRNELTFYLAMYDRVINEIDGSYSKNELLTIKGPFKVSLDYKPRLQMNEETIKFKELVSKYIKDFSGYEEFLLILLYVAKKEINTGFFLRGLCIGREEEKELVEIADNLNLIIYLETILSQRKSDEDKVSMIAFGDFRSISSEWYEENLDWAFDYIYNRIVDIKKIKQSTQLNAFSSLFAELIGADAGYVYLPYAGLEAIKLIREKSKETRFNFVLQNEGYESNILRLYLLIKKTQKYKILNSNPSTEWYGDGMDYILLTPSKDSKLENIERIKYLERSAFDVRRKSVGIYNLPFVGKERISNLIEKDLLEYVILLPKDVLLSNNTDNVLIVTSKDKQRVGEVCFIDALACLTKEGTHRVLDVDAILSMLGQSTDGENVRWVKNEEIAEYDYLVHPYIYTSLNEYVYPNGYIKIGLGEIIEPIYGVGFGSYRQGLVITDSELNRTLIDCLSPLESKGKQESLYHTVRVDEPVILFSMKRDCLFTYCESSTKEPINVGNDIMLFRLKDDAKKWVNPYYLCYELSRNAEVFKRRILTFGISQYLFSSVGLSQLLKVAFPSKNIKDQELILGQLRNQLEDTLKKTVSLQEIIERMKTDYMNQVRARKHDMSPYVGTLKDVCCDLNDFLQQYDEESEFYKEIKYQYNRLHKAISGLTSIIEVLSNEIEDEKLEELDIDEYFTSLIVNHNCKKEGYELIYKKDENSIRSQLTELCPLYIKIAKVHFERIVNNIKENAKKHGYVDKSKNYRLEIRLSLPLNGNMFQIDFVNNGKPLPKGINKEYYGMLGMKAGPYGNTGIGGNVIKILTQRYNGDYDIFMDNDSTVIRILFPLSDKNTFRSK